MKNIVILNGSSRKNGNTSKLVNAFMEGARSSGNHVQEFYLNTMNINECTGCNACTRSTSADNPCIQKDDMHEIYQAFTDADVIVFASPIYFWTITGTLKTAVDRLYGTFSNSSRNKLNKETALLMTAGGYDYSGSLHWYRNFENFLHWKTLGEVLGSDKINEARALGESIK